MRESFLVDLHNNGFVEMKTINGEECFCLSTPCRFTIDKNVVKELRDKYLPNEEIGGVLWAKPTLIEGEKTFTIEKVKFIRNAIEDKPHYDGKLLLNKQIAYLRDQKEYQQEIKVFQTAGYLPIKFHTHPTKGNNVISTIINQILQTETSHQDKISSKQFDIIGKKKILIPRGLIVGNKELTNDLFVGLYDGFIAPEGFEESKQKVREAQLKKIADTISSINLTPGQKIGVGIGAAILLMIIIKYPKFSIPVILGLAAVVSLTMTETKNHEKVNYFNRLSEGEANIYIP